MVALYLDPAMPEGRLAVEMDKGGGDVGMTAWTSLELALTPPEVPTV
jgi:hypothetical protein